MLLTFTRFAVDAVDGYQICCGCCGILSFAVGAVGLVLLMLLHSLFYMDVNFMFGPQTTCMSLKVWLGLTDCKVNQWSPKC